MRRTIAIDFDGTIVDSAFPLIGKLKKNAKKVINELSKQYDICIYSCRSNGSLPGSHIAEQEMINFLKKEGIHYDYIAKGKPISILYIDDRAHEFKSWSRVERKLLKSIDR